MSITPVMETVNTKKTRREISKISLRISVVYYSSH
jgi:hypothetical protein